ncbi:Ribosomal RNA large subunit methyltransferase F-like protein [Corchorus olitorius]|uniref:U6 small nuclear RNA (adenine-(43)-N(6))-methyltransferase n=1 Tax=Corchorus olitorius TaxID=93759 RepID=A0A1R3JDC6_9ROSI|nr:Ribosomal RNA large subunit methyltransferase F-like protein [Corchorus olitorius]
MPSKKRRRKEERPKIHPKNKYSDNPPDFALLASLYPSFKPFVFYSREGRPKIDWTDFNATRELTRVLLLHDHGLDWWIPDGQLCPTVPNRSNYIHWIEDLLSSDIIPKTNSNGDNVRGFDIGTGANCIYPLLGASLLGWSFVASDVTDVALEWAERNVKSNQHVSELIEIRKVKCSQNTHTPEVLNNTESTCSEEGEGLPSSSFHMPESKDKRYHGPPILVNVVRDGEKFDFCMCNPPFFESIEEAGLNPKTSCGGTHEEMVCPGGEKAFITCIIEDSAVLKQSFRWYTSMVGRKVNLKFLIAKLREVGVTIVKTTEFVQGQTCRWGLAWSFVPPTKKIIAPHVTEKNIISFMLEGLQRQFGAVQVLQSVESFFHAVGASCKSNASTFTVDITASTDHCNVLLRNEVKHHDEVASCSNVQEASPNLCFRVSVFQQIPGTLLIKGSLQHRDSPLSGLFSSIIQQLEDALRSKFCREKANF